MSAACGRFCGCGDRHLRPGSIKCPLSSPAADAKEYHEPLHAAAPAHRLMSLSTSRGGCVPLGNMGKSGLRRSVPSAAMTNGWHRDSTSLRVGRATHQWL